MLLLWPRKAGSGRAVAFLSFFSPGKNPAGMFGFADVVPRERRQCQAMIMWCPTSGKIFWLLGSSCRRHWWNATENSKVFQHNKTVELLWAVSAHHACSSIVLLCHKRNASATHTSWINGKDNLHALSSPLDCPCGTKHFTTTAAKACAVFGRMEKLDDALRWHLL